MDVQIFWIHWWGHNGVGKLPNIVFHQHQHDPFLPMNIVGHPIQVVFKLQTRCDNLHNLLKKSKFPTRSYFPQPSATAQILFWVARDLSWHFPTYFPLPRATLIFFPLPEATRKSTLPLLTTSCSLC
jgi:hypothetical protein